MVVLGYLIVLLELVSLMLVEVEVGIIILRVDQLEQAAPAGADLV